MVSIGSLPWIWVFAKPQMMKLTNHVPWFNFFWDNPFEELKIESILLNQSYNIKEFYLVKNARRMQNTFFFL